MKAVIIAAGKSSRLSERTDNLPKTLLPFGHETILSTILKNISKAGIQEFVIVVGYQSEHIVNYLRKNEYFGLKISFVENSEWERGNGISVLAVEDAVKQDDFLLSMSDHIVSVDAINRIVNYKSSRNLLLVDPKIHEVFDIDDATKVEVQDNMIVNIGKEIKNYNCIDCGIFRLNSRFFSSMRERLKTNKESISDSVIGLIHNEDMEAAFTRESDSWIDIDTKEAYEYALKKYYR